MQLIYISKTQRCLDRYDFRVSCPVSFIKNHWSNTERSIEFFRRNYLFLPQKSEKGKQDFQKNNIDLLL